MVTPCTECGQIDRIQRVGPLLDAERSQTDKTITSESTRSLLAARFAPPVMPTPASPSLEKPKPPNPPDVPQTHGCLVAFLSYMVVGISIGVGMGDDEGSGRTWIALGIATTVALIYYAATIPTRRRADEIRARFEPQRVEYLRRLEEHAVLVQSAEEAREAEIQSTRHRWQEGQDRVRAGWYCSRCGVVSADGVTFEPELFVANCYSTQDPNSGQVDSLGALVEPREAAQGIDADSDIAAAEKSSIRAQPSHTEEAVASLYLVASGPQKVSLIRVLREQFGLNLMDAKTLVDNAPTYIAHRLDRGAATSAKTHLEAFGAVVELR